VFMLISVLQCMHSADPVLHAYMFCIVLIVANVNWSGHNFTLEQKDGGITTGYPVAGDISVPNGIKDFSRPVSDMLAKNAHLCSVLNAPLPNSLNHMPTKRMPVAANCHPCTPSVDDRRIAGGNHLAQVVQSQYGTFSNGAQTYYSVYPRLPGNRPAIRGYCDNSISVHGCYPPVNGLLVSCAETRNGYCTNTAMAPSMIVGQPVPCRSYAPVMQWSVAPATSAVSSELVCKMNGAADVTTSFAPLRTNSSSSNLHLSTAPVTVSSAFLYLRSESKFSTSVTKVCKCLSELESCWDRDSSKIMVLGHRQRPQ